LLVTSIFTGELSRVGEGWGYVCWYVYFYCYVYVFLLLCMLCSVYSVFIVQTGTLRLPWL